MNRAIGIVLPLMMLTTSLYARTVGLRLQLMLLAGFAVAALIGLSFRTREDRE